MRLRSNDSTLFEFFFFFFAEARDIELDVRRRAIMKRGPRLLRTLFAEAADDEGGGEWNGQKPLSEINPFGNATARGGREYFAGARMI